MTEIVGFACPPRCDAGGTESDGGHVFDQEVTFDNGWSSACHCGMTAMDWSLWRHLDCDHVNRDDVRRICNDCGECYSYLGLEPRP